MLERTRQLHREVEVPAIRPFVHAPAADQSVVADHPQFGIGDLCRERRVGMVAVGEVQQQMPRAGSLEGIAMQAGAQRGGQLGKNVVIGQAHSVIARPRLLRGPVVTRPITVSRSRLAVRRKLGRGTRHAIVLRMVVLLRQAAATRLQQHRPLRRHQQHIKHVANARATEMGVRKTHDRAVALVIARTGIPSAVMRIGAELHHAKRQRRPRIRVAMPAGAGEYVDVAGPPGDCLRPVSDHGVRPISGGSENRLQAGPTAKQRQ